MPRKRNDHVIHQAFGYGTLIDVNREQALVQFGDRLMSVPLNSLTDAHDEFPPGVQEAMTQLFETQHEIDLTIKLSGWMAYQIVSYLQLTYRHPGLNRRQRKEIRHYADQFIPVGYLHPILADLLSKGWEELFDIPGKDST